METARFCLRGQVWLALAGLLLGFGALGALIWMAVLFMKEKHVGLAATVVLAIATVIGVFVYGSRGMRPPPKDADQTDPSNPDAKASGD